MRSYSNTLKMKYATPIGIAAVGLMFIAAFLPWLYIESKDITVSGLATTGTSFGKPGMMNLILSAIALLLFFIRKVGAKRINFFICGINMAWAFRNYLILNLCYAGECPEMQYGLYISIVAAIIMFVCSMMPDIKIPLQEEDKNAS